MSGGHVARPDGGRLFYRDEGAANDRAPVLCLPGLTRNGRDFDALAAHLAPRRRVIRPDMRGRGLSDPGAPDSYTVAVEAGDVLALLDALAIARVVVVGTSRGGLQAMALAAMRPALILGAVLNDVGPDVDMAGLRRIVEGMRAARRDHADWTEAEAATSAAHAAALPDLTDRQWRAMTRALFVERDGRPTLAYDPALTGATAAAVAALEASDPAHPAPDLWPLFDRLAQGPVVALRGALSDVLTAATLERMAHDRPTVRAITVARRGHAPLLDEPACLAGIDALLAEIDGRTPPEGPPHDR